MAKKRKNLESKLGSWTDQASLTRSQAQEPQSVGNQSTKRTATRETYDVNRSLMDRIQDMAIREEMSQNELIGYLLTWSLDQVEGGMHRIEREK